MLIENRLDSGMRVWHAKPVAKEPKPAVLLLHERYGPVTHSFNVIERFATSGYVAAMPDFFHRFDGDRGPIERSEDRIDLVDTETVVDIDESIQFLRSLPYVDGGQIGIVGFCLSGRTPIVYAVAHPDETAAIAIVHGGIYPRDYHADKAGQAPIEPLIDQLSCPILGLFGENDNLVPMENIARFRQELERNRKRYHIRVYPETPHGWMNSTEPDRYLHTTSEDSWNLLSKFFDQIFNGEWSTERNSWLFESDVRVRYDFST